MSDEILEKVENYIDSDFNDIPLATGEEIGRTVDYTLGRNRYIAFLIQTVTKSFKHFKVGLDCSNGASSQIAKNVYDALGAKTYVINDDPDGFNINRDCGSTHIDKLQKFVVENNLDCGFAFDGDADRCICVDHEGNVLDGDSILYVCGSHLKKINQLENDTVVTTIMSNLGLYKAFDKVGIKYEKTDVGDKYVSQNMQENGHIIGGEQSGHIVFSKFSNTGDGILTSLQMMEVMIENKSNLKSLVRDLKIYPQILENVRVKSKKETLENDKVRSIIEKVSKDLGDEGRVLVRQSGTEPVIRVMVEAKDIETCKEKVSEIIDVIYESGLNYA